MKVEKKNYANQIFFLIKKYKINNSLYIMQN